MEHFDIYIHRVLKQVHPDTRISGESVQLINDIVNCLALAISHKAVRLVQPLNYDPKTRKTPLGKKTITARDIQAAVRLVLPGELAKYSVSEGTNAVVKYASYVYPKKSPKPIVSKAQKARLRFSPARAEALLRRHLSLRIGDGAPVYLAAVLEYITAEILELAGNLCLSQKMVTVMPRHVKDSVVDDEELHRLMSHLHMVLPGFKDQKHGKKDRGFNDAMAYLV